MANLPETAETNLKDEKNLNQKVQNIKKSFAVSGQVEPMVIRLTLVARHQNPVCF